MSFHLNYESVCALFLFCFRVLLFGLSFPHCFLITFVGSHPEPEFLPLIKVSVLVFTPLSH